MQPITFAPRPRLTCPYFDLRDAWGKIHLTYGMDKARCGYGVANMVGPPYILFIGSSHIDHMRHLKNPEENGDGKKSSGEEKAKSDLEKDSQLRDALNLLKGIHLANARTQGNSG